jgi:4-phytase/acid phosphatase
LTDNGVQAETLLGAYFRQYLLYEGLLTGNDHTDSAQSYFRSNSIERSWKTAAAFGLALLPDTGAPVHSFQINPASQPDPVFDPIAGGVANVDVNVAATQAQEIFNSGAALQSAYSAEYSMISYVLWDNTQPPAGKTDPTTEQITLLPNTSSKLATGNVINPGGLSDVQDAIDPFVMQYCDNFDMSDVAWGRLTITPTLDQLSQETRIATLVADIELRTPYLAQVQSSNAASHILRTMQQAVNGSTLRGSFGNAKSRIVVAISSDTYVAALAGLLNVHWQLPGYQQDFCAPGGALVFELRQSNSTKQYLVRVYYTAQTFDQLRYLMPLTLNEPPATIQLMVPGGSKSETDLDVDFSVFRQLVQNAIGKQYVQNPSTEVQPGILTGVTCQ